MAIVAGSYNFYVTLASYKTQLSVISKNYQSQIAIVPYKYQLPDTMDIAKDQF